MAVQKRPPQTVEVDLEATAELPAIDFTSSELALPESTMATDVFQAPVVPAGVADLADSLREVEARLQRKIERLSKLEGELDIAKLQGSRLQAQLDDIQRTSAEREAALRTELASAEQTNADLQRDLAAAQNSLTAARGQVQAQRAALSESQQASEQHANAQRHLERDLAELRRRSAQQLEALGTWQGFRAVSEAQLLATEDQVRSAESLHASAIAEAQARYDQLQSETCFARDEAAARISTLEQSLQLAGQGQSSQAEQLRTATAQIAQQSADLAARDATIAELNAQVTSLRALEEQSRAGIAAYDAQRKEIEDLKAELVAAAKRFEEVQVQGRLTDERLQRLESEAHASAALLGNLQQNIERLGRDDTDSRPALKLVPPAVESVVRVLIRQEGGSDVVYPLSRRTTIGRTPENDIQVDTTFVSRHHAVLLSNGDHCIVEDLNSTNGVLVNGRRVGRQILHDGDSVTIGRTEFRYQQRS